MRNFADEESSLNELELDREVLGDQMAVPNLPL